MPLCVALYLGLTGVRINDPADLLQFGLGTHYVPSDRLAELRAQLADCTLSASNAADKLRQCVEACAGQPPPAGADSIAAHMDTVEGVMRPGIDVMDGGGSCVDAICAVQAHAQELTVRPIQHCAHDSGRLQTRCMQYRIRRLQVFA